MGYRPGKAVELPNNDDLEFSLVGVGNQAVQLWAAFLGTGDANIHVLGDKRPSAAMVLATGASREAALAAANDALSQLKIVTA